MAVYTEVPDNELRAFVDQYEIGEVVSCKGIAEGVENSNFLLHTASGAYIRRSMRSACIARTCPFSSA